MLYKIMVLTGAEKYKILNVLRAYSLEFASGLVRLKIILNGKYSK